jgi:hypothetical protein
MVLGGIWYRHHLTPQPSQAKLSASRVREAIGRALSLTPSKLERSLVAR